MQVLEEYLEAFRASRNIINVGALCTVLVVTRNVKQMPFPIAFERLLSKGGGQVAGLSGAAAMRSSSTVKLMLA